MKDNDKTQKQLTKELAQLRRRVAELEASERERKEVEEALKKNDQDKTAVLDSISEHVVYHDKKMRIQWANKVAGESVGLDPQHLVGRHCYEIWQQRRKPCVGCPVVKARKSGRSQEAEMTSPDGRVWLVRGYPVQDAKGNVKGAVEVTRDITARKKAEKELRESEERFRLAFENANTGVCLVDLEGNLTRVNSKMSEIFGYTKEELERMTVNDIAHPEDIDKSPEFIQKTLQGEIDRATFEKRYIHKKGHVVTCEVSSSLVRDAEGAPLYFISHVHDISDRKRAEEAHRESETRFRTLFEAIPDTVLVLDDEGTILHINEISAQQLEWSAKDLVGRNLREIVTPENRALIADHIKETRTTGWSRFETTYVSRSGWQIIAEVNDRPIKFGKDKAILRVSRDISERKRLEEILEKEREELKLIIDSSPIIVFYKDKEGRFIRVNRTLAGALNMPEENFVGKTVFDLYSPQIAQGMTDDDQEVFQSRRPKLNIIEQYESATGIRWVQTDKIPIFDKNGMPVGLIGFAQDITGRKQAEARAEHLNLVLLAIRGVNQLITREKDRDRLIQGACDKLIETRGYDNVWIALIDESGRLAATAEAGLGEGFLPLVEQLEHSELPYCMRMALTQAGALIIEDPFATCADCSLSNRYGDRRAMATRFEHDGKIYGMMTVSISGDYVADEEEQTLFGEVGEDIAFALYSIELEEKRRQAEAAVRESEERFRTVVETMKVGLGAIDEKGVLTYVNKYFSTMLGYTIDEMIGRSTLDFYYDEESRKTQEEIFAKRRAGMRDPTPYEVTWRKKDGQKVYSILSPTPIFDANGRYTGSFAIHTDITERKQAEEELQRSYQQMREMLVTSVNALAATVEMKDQYTAGHQPRATQLACAIAEEIGLAPEQIEGIRMAGSLHDIGKIVVPAEILNKPGPLAEVQYEMVKMHPRAGYDIVKVIKFPWPVAQIVLQHHELMDGSGYPQGLSGEQIMVEARILAVANVVEAMTSHRPYRAAHSIETALEEISRNKGKLYDPVAVDACLKLFTEKRFTFN